MQWDTSSNVMWVCSNRGRNPSDGHFNGNMIINCCFCLGAYFQRNSLSRFWLCRTKLYHDQLRLGKFLVSELWAWSILVQGHQSSLQQVACKVASWNVKAGELIATSVVINCHSKFSDVFLEPDCLIFFAACRDEVQEQFDGVRADWYMGRLTVAEVHQLLHASARPYQRSL